MRGIRVRLNAMGKTELKIEIDTDLLQDARAAGVQVELMMQEAVRTALISRTDASAADARGEVG